jgi:hypothetical protein
MPPRRTKELGPSLLDDLQERFAIQNKLVEEQLAKFSPTGNLSRIFQKDGSLKPNVELGIRLKLSGLDHHIAGKAADVEPDLILKALQTEPGKKLQERFRTEMETDFKNLQSLVVQSIEKCLRSADPQVSLGAANLWLRTEKEARLKVEFTAEDVIKDLLEKRNADNGQP